MKCSGMFWVAGMLSSEDLCVAATYDEMQLSAQEVDSHVQSLLGIISKLTEEGNWDLTVGEILNEV